MTEAKAKTKWCPYAGQARAADSMAAALMRMQLRAVGVRGGGGGAGGDNSSDGNLPDRCIGSACMVWRFVGPMPLAGHLERDGRSVVDRWSEASKTHGFCGLAGKP